jgi:hypothetical protein
MVLTDVLRAITTGPVIVKDAIAQLRLRSVVKERGMKKAARTKRSFSQYVEDLIVADTQPTRRPKEQAE